MKSTQKNLLGYVIVPLLTLLLGWELGMTADARNDAVNIITGGSGSVSDEAIDTVDLSLFWTVWRTLSSHYVEPAKLEVTPMLYGAIAGMVEAVDDPYTVFMTPKENTDFRDGLSGHLQGIGAELTEEDGQILVVSPLKGSPAEKAGLLPQDIIVEVDGTDMAGKHLNEVVSLIRGPKGTRVTLTILRGQESNLRTFTITRDDIRVPSTEYEVKKTEKGNVGYLAINQFGAETVSEVRQILINDVKPDELKGLIIDLRYNGGGYLDGAIDIASMFIEKGTVVSVAGREGVMETHKVTGDVILYTIPLVVLQNQASASASEILAGALQDHDRATIIGMQSFGKGTVQEVIDLPGGTSLRVTVARWLTPDGHDLGKQGVTPDIVVDRTQEDFDAKRDPQLDAALLWLTEGKKPTAPAASTSSTR